MVAAACAGEAVTDVLNYQRMLEDMREFLATDLGDETKVAAIRRTVDNAIAGVFEHAPPPALEAQQCRSCGADIIWITTLAGKHAPCDKGFRNVTTVDGRTVRGHESHFSTCPNRDQHRKR